MVVVAIGKCYKDKIGIAMNNVMVSMKVRQGV